MEGGRGSVGEVFRYFLRLGFIAFGGPAAHIALMRRELVVQRRWVSDEQFIDLMGVTNLIPGPNSTEMTMHLGGQRAGWRGLWLGGAAFILPAVSIVLVLAWAYVEWGETPAGEALMYGIQPVILAIIVQAIWGLRSAAVKGPATGLVVVAAVALVLLGVNEVFVLLGAGLLLLVASLVSGRRSDAPWPKQIAAGWKSVEAALRRPLRLAVAPLGLFQTVATSSPDLASIFLAFLKIGSILYGSGYVLVSFLESEFVDSRGWLTEEQLLDAVAVGQFTPGPVFSTATFVGYLLEGVPGAIVATVGIFLPSFVFVMVTHPLVPKLRGSRWAAPFLDGVNAAAIALMAVVVITLSLEALDSVFQVALLAAAAVVLVRWNVNSAWLVLGGAAAGIAYSAIT